MKVDFVTNGRFIDVLRRCGYGCAAALGAMILTLVAPTALARVDLPVFEIKKGETVNYIVGTLHFSSDRGLPRDISSVVRDNPGIYVFESDVLVRAADVIRADVDNVRKRCGLYKTVDHDGRRLLDAAISAIAADGPAAKSALLSEWQATLAEVLIRQPAEVHAGVELTLAGSIDLGRMEFFESYPHELESTNCLDRAAAVKSAQRIAEVIACKACHVRASEVIGRAFSQSESIPWASAAKELLCVWGRCYFDEDKLMRRRNERFTKELNEIFGIQRFVAFVGISHLIGDDSMLQQFVNLGYSVREIVYRQ